MPEFPSNPYRPGAGHMPPYLAGRTVEYAEFDNLLKQDVITQNMILTGLRGLGKTVLLETLRGRALKAGWLWAGTDLSEAASVTELTVATRLLVDLSVVTSAYSSPEPATMQTGFAVPGGQPSEPLDFAAISRIYDQTPGLTSDRLKHVLEMAHEAITAGGHSGKLIFAYDEAQNLSDSAATNEYPLSLILDVFQHLQRKGIRFMLVLTGLPTLPPKVVEARAFAERLFRVITLDRLSDSESREAITKPLEKFPIQLNEVSVEVLLRESGGYPYFIQFMCREAFDVFIGQISEDNPLAPVPIDAIQRKLDADFFAPRWASITDRRRDLLYVAAVLDSPDEFSLQDLCARSHDVLSKGFSNSHAVQMLGGLIESGLIYKNRFGKYSFAVPLLDKFIIRNYVPQPAA